MPGINHWQLPSKKLAFTLSKKGFVQAYSALISQFSDITAIQKMLVVFQRTFLGQTLKHGITFLGFAQAPLSLAYSRL